jgi:hypothetical protein
MASGSLLLPLKGIIERKGYIHLHFALPFIFLNGLRRDYINERCIFLRGLLYHAKYEDMLSNVNIYLISEVYTTVICAVFMYLIEYFKIVVASRSTSLYGVSRRGLYVDINSIRNYKEIETEGQVDTLPVPLVSRYKTRKAN